MFDFYISLYLYGLVTNILILGVYLIFLLNLYNTTYRKNLRKINLSLKNVVFNHTKKSWIFLQVILYIFTIVLSWATLPVNIIIIFVFFMRKKIENENLQLSKLIFSIRNDDTLSLAKVLVFHYIISNGLVINNYSTGEFSKDIARKSNELGLDLSHEEISNILIQII